MVFSTILLDLEALGPSPVRRRVHTNGIETHPIDFTQALLPHNVPNAVAGSGEAECGEANWRSPSVN